MSRPIRLVIAVDGPAASGKGTIARALARHYALPYLDTGLLYRAVGATVAAQAGDPADEAAALSACAFDDAVLTHPGLRSEQAGSLASIVSAHPAVRRALIERQRRFAGRPEGAILDGRDIGTVIAPDAAAKLFVCASAEVRAQRRHDEMARMGIARSLADLLAEIRDRDARDRSRATAPLVQARDADLLDTSDLTIDAAVQRAIALVDARTASHDAGHQGA